MSDLKYTCPHCEGRGYIFNEYENRKTKCILCKEEGYVIPEFVVLEWNGAMHKVYTRGKFKGSIIPYKYANRNGNLDIKGE